MTTALTIPATEIRATGTISLDASKPRTVVGHAAVFNQRSWVGPKQGGFFEEVLPGAFRSSLSSDVRLLQDHDPQRVLARTKAGTLQIDEDARGLAFEATLPDTSYAHDLAALIARGDVTGASFRFFTPPKKEHWSFLPDGSELRSLEDLDLVEVSIVTFPQYPDAEVALRSASFTRPTRPARALRFRTWAAYLGKEL